MSVYYLKIVDYYEISKYYTMDIIPAFASADPLPPPFIVNLNCTDFLKPSKRTVLEFEDLDPS